MALAVSLVLLAGCSGATSDIDEERPERPEMEVPRETASSESAPREVPQGTFTGTGGGCADLLVFRGSADGTQYAVVQIDKEVVGLDVGAVKTIDLGSTPAGVGVFVDVYASALESETPYCTDYRSESPAMTRWTAEAGKLTIELATDPASTDESHPTYRATLRLETVHFTSPEGGFAVIVPSVVIADVRVGWLPG